MGSAASRGIAPDEIERQIDAMADTLPEPAPPAPTDPRLPLTARQVFKIKKSWKGVKRCLSATGIEMFIRFFKANSDLKQMFKSFKDIQTDDELRESEDLEKHATNVMTIFDDAIANVENVDYIFELLHRTGKLHTGFQGFTPESFWRMEQPFLESVKLTLDERYTENMDGIYKITIKFFLGELVKGCEMALS